jgi:DNA repair protein SbcD/Mre11
MASLEMSAEKTEDIYSNIESRISELIEGWLEECDPSLPVVLTAHASIEGAKYGGERLVMLGNDLVLSGSLVKNPKFNYVAMGHIHKPQDVNEGNQPPVVYPGSIERVDFGEAKEERFFVIADVECRERHPRGVDSTHRGEKIHRPPNSSDVQRERDRGS